MADLITRSDFIAGARGLLRKHFAVETKADDAKDSRIIKFTISTATRDRHGDSIKPSGWTLANYRANSVVQWAHDGKIPSIAKAPKTRLQNKKLLVSDADFVPKEIHPFADMIYRLYKGKFLNAVSVGFKPDQWEWLKDAEDSIVGIKYLSQDLLEFSCCNVPSNPDALMHAKSAGIDLAPMFGWAEKALDNSDDMIVLTLAGCDRKVLEAARKVSDPKQRLSVLVKGYKIQDLGEPPEEQERDVDDSDPDDPSTRERVNDILDEFSNAVKSVVKRLDSVAAEYEEFEPNRRTQCSHTRDADQGESEDEDPETQERTEPNDSEIGDIVAGVFKSMAS